MMSIVLALKVDAGTAVRRGRDHFWSVVRDLTATDRSAIFWTIDVVQRSAGVEISTVRRELALLARAGYLAKEDGDAWRVLRRPTRLPSLSADGREVRSGQSAMWTAIRALGSFTHSELAVASSTEELLVSPVAAKSYVLRLGRAGYLKLLRSATPKRQALWRLRPSMNTGPLPPKILRAKLVYDPNRNEIVGPVDAEEVSP